jgi:hypothetical protein
LVLVNLQHRRIIPLMERGLRIFEMEVMANPVALTRSRLVHDRIPPKYAATRARRAIKLKAVRNSNDDLWSFIMLPDGPLVRGGSLHPPHLEPRRRQSSERQGRARERPPPGGLRKGRRAPRWRL